MSTRAGEVLRILVCTRDYLPEVGGVQNNVLVLARGLAARPGTEVTVVTRGPAGTFDDAAQPFRTVRRWDPLTLWRLAGAADAIHVATPSLLPLVIGLLRRKPVAVVHHMYEAVCPSGFLYYEPDGTLCPSHFMARRYQHCLRCNARTVGWRRSVKKLLLAFPRRWLARRVAANVGVTHHVTARVRLPGARTIYHGIPPEVADGGDTRVDGHLPGSDQPEHGVAGGSGRAEDVPSYAYVGRLVSEKGVSLLLDAAAQLKRERRAFRVKIVGDGPQRHALEAQAAALDLNREVRFLGFLRGERLRAAVADVTAVVMPSRWEESFGLAAVEHMMRGRLVIAADIGGLGEVVGATGLLFRPGDSADLTRCLRQAMDAPGLADQLGAAARARAQRSFSEERMVTNHLALCRVLAGHASHPQSSCAQNTCTSNPAQHHPALRTDRPGTDFAGAAPDLCATDG
jgi:glycosyltransferase involved in cell wall biosynthesis